MGVTKEVLVKGGNYCLQFGIFVPSLGEFYKILENKGGKKKLYFWKVSYQYKKRFNEIGTDLLFFNTVMSKIWVKKA
jgi:hypothetical protein